MEARLLLAARVDALRADLTLAATALRNEAIRQDLRQRVFVMFSGEIDRLTTKLETLSTNVKNQSANDHGSLTDLWAGFEQHRAECEKVLKEYLRFLEGALVRTAKLDNGICDVADAFLRELADITDKQWRRFTMLADDEFISPLSEIIRVGYPHFGIWNLPVLAHEFGHYVSDKLRDRLDGTAPLRQLRTDIRRKVVGAIPGGAGDRLATQTLAHLDEYIADAFAVYVAGPAYPCECLVLRFEPVHASEEGAEHPSDGNRAYLLLRVLNGLGPGFQKIATTLRSIWQANLETAGRPAMPASDDWLDPITDRLIAAFDDVIPAARVDVPGWRAAIGLSNQLLSPAWQQQTDSLTLRAIINGAWLCRLTSDGDWHTPTISDRALELARAAADRATNRLS